MSISNINNFPNVPYWAILTTKTTYTPGDERSRTHPGHGYPESYSTDVVFTAYDNEDEWKDAIRHLEIGEGKGKYQAIQVLPANVKLTTSVDITMVHEEQPYLKALSGSGMDRRWNPDYDQQAYCICGHTYDRHFDSYEQFAPVRCKYCECDTFKLFVEPQGEMS